MKMEGTASSSLLKGPSANPQLTISLTVESSSLTAQSSLHIYHFHGRKIVSVSVSWMTLSNKQVHDLKAENHQGLSLHDHHRLQAVLLQPALPQGPMMLDETPLSEELPITL